MLTTKLLLNIHRLHPSTVARAKYPIIYLIHICFAGSEICLLNLQRQAAALY